MMHVFKRNRWLHQLSTRQTVIGWNKKAFWGLPYQFNLDQEESWAIHNVFYVTVSEKRRKKLTGKSEKNVKWEKSRCILQIQTEIYIPFRVNISLSLSLGFFSLRHGGACFSRTGSSARLASLNIFSYWFRFFVAMRKFWLHVLWFHFFVLISFFFVAMWNFDCMFWDFIFENLVWFVTEA